MAKQRSEISASLESGKVICMETRICVAVCALLAFAAMGGRALGQANVSENQNVYLYVAAAGGSDANPGTESQPLQSIGAAVNRANTYASQNVGVRIEVEPGVYHEFVQVGWARQNPTLTIEATQTGQAVIDGADTYTGWSTGNGQIYTHSFSGLGSNPVPSGWPGSLPGVVYRREMVFVNGGPLTQVMSASQLRPGTFYVNDGAHEIELQPTPGTNMNTATVEVADRPYTLRVQGRNNVVLRGLVLEHAAAYMNDLGANVFTSSNVLIDRVQATENNWGGLGIHGGANITLQNSVASDNGGLGFMAVQTKQLLVQYDEADRNNWRGAMGGFYDFGMGGMKFFRTHGATIQRFYAFNNGAEGLWFDTDNRQISVSDSVLSGNYDANLQLELNYGPISVTNTAMCYGTVGMNLVNAENLTFSGDTFYGNGGGSPLTKPNFFLAGQPGGRGFTDWETGKYYWVVSQNVKFMGNSFQDVASGQKLFYTYLSGSDLRTFLGNFSSSGNTWYDSSAPGFQLGGTQLNFSGWRSETGQDRNSQWAPAGAPAGCGAPADPTSDFALFGATTQMWATYHASNGQATIPIQVKNFGTGGAVNLTVSELPGGVQASFASGALAAAATGSSAEQWTTLRLSANGYSGTANVYVTATSGSRVHTMQVPVYF
jgi:hypothetical protein